MGSARTRATVSVGPPAGNDTTIVMGCDGKVSTRASVVVARAAAIANEARAIVRGCIVAGYRIGGDQSPGMRAVLQPPGPPESALGQTRSFDDLSPMSGLPSVSRPPLGVAGGLRSANRCREQMQQQKGFHSITLSARIKSVSGITRPSAFAVLRLITSSKVVGCWTGTSRGCSPRSNLATGVAICQ